MNNRTKFRAIWLGTIIFFLTFEQLSATTHYVSRSGSNTPPYDTWEKATDSLGLAFKIANTYDTVQVAAGTFYSDSNEIIFKPGMVLIGAGRDSTHIIRSPVMSAAYFFYFANFCQVKKVRMNGMGNTSVAVITLDSARATTIEENLFEGFYSSAINLSNCCFYDRTFTRIVNNIFDNCGIGFQTVSGLIQGNIFRNAIIYFDFIYSPYVTIANNIFGPNSGRCIRGDVSDSGRVVNNIFFDVDAEAIDFFGPEISNNHLFRTGVGIVVNTALGRVANNTMVDNLYDFAVQSGANFDSVHHNAVWRTNGPRAFIVSYAGGARDTLVPTNNYSFDPMFVDSVDWELQFASPAIDTGDTAILDLDATRSDLGVWGGPWGNITSYPDLSPRSPLNFSGLVQPDSTVVLSWKPNTEADLGNYLLFRDTISGVLADSAHLWAILPKTDSVFLDGKLTESRFYKLVAIDTTGHSSNPTLEVALITTGVGDEPGTLPRQFEMYQNYPNPFNAGTVISYSLSHRSPVKLEIFNIIGQLVRTLVSAEQPAGYRQIRWDGTDAFGKPLPSGIYLYKLQAGDEVETKKMTLIR
ncbi:MAG TPA: FlgD immunoglobulin-like domain containing protein [Verrucomicrobiae bacterium]|nr:FlgD immunoglobulin-like domain containing protein [Verrucomicrobiae bacterium]